MDCHLEFHHIGIACLDIDKTSRLYVDQGYTPSPVIEDHLLRVRVCFMELAGQPRLELLEPLDEQSPVTRTLEKTGVTPYHICYEVQDIEAAIASLRSSHRFLLVKGPVPACAMEDRRVAFMYQKNTGLIELVEAKAALL